MPIRKILVPTDLSNSANEALERAVEIAKMVGAEIHLLHVYQIPIGVGVNEPIPMPEQYFAQLRKQAGEELRTLEQKVRAVVPAGVQTHLKFDYPGRTILEFAKSLPADLIVMGTRGLTGMKHVLLGSIAERVVRLAPCDVLTVKSSQVQDS